MPIEESVFEWGQDLAGTTRIGLMSEGIGGIVSHSEEGGKYDAKGRWAVLVIWANGDQEFARQGAFPTGEVATFTKREARARADFFREGMDAGEVQSVNVVRAPR